MPAFSLVLNKLEIAIPAKRLSLFVDSSVSLQCSTGNMQPMSVRQLLDLLCSGKVWVTRGNGCHIDFTILPDKQEDDDLAIARIIEILGPCIRDAPLWSQMSLNVKLEPPDRDSRAGIKPSFSIGLKHPPFATMSGQSVTPLLSIPTDVQVPAGFPCFQLRNIKVVMIFNVSSITLGNACQHLQSPLPSLLADGTKDYLEEKFNSTGDTTGLTSCLLLHQAALNISQVAHSISSLYSGPLICQNREMLDKDILLCNADNAIPLTNPSLTQSPSGFPSRPNSQEEIEDTAANYDIRSITSDLSCIRKMTDLALRNLFGGRQNKSYPGIKVVSRWPTLTLSKIAPSLFSPGFAEAISRRSQFVPTISHALSVSLLRNAQSPSLRRKLLSLVSTRAASPDNGAMMDSVDDKDDQPELDNHEISRSLGQIVEGRLWTMMQRSLYDPSSTRHFSPPEEDGTSVSGVSAAGIAEISASGPVEAESVMDELFSPTSYLLDFVEDDFEDLFNDLPDIGETDNFEALFCASTNEGSVDAFEDLLEEEPPGEPDYAVYRGVEVCERDFDMIADDSVRYRENVQNINTGDL